MIRTFTQLPARNKRLDPQIAPLAVIVQTIRVAIYVAFAVALPVFAAVPPDPVAVVRTLADQDAAVLRVGERLAVASAAWCGHSGQTAGMMVQQLSQYGDDFRAAAHAVLGITTRPTVAQIAPGGAAEAAGLRPGDVILSIDGYVFPDVTPRRGSGTFAEIAKAHDMIDTALADGRAQLTILRGDGAPRAVTVKPLRACRARFDIRPGRSNNASADGTYIQVSSDLMAQSRGDGELAAILAHELAHNVLDHRRRLRAKDSRLKVRTTEIEADRLSVYLLNAAGYASADAVGFWQRWGRANDLGIFSDRTHPGWKKRIATIEAETAAIAALSAAGKPVAPPPDLRLTD